MLFFYCAEEAALSSIQQEGVRGGGGARLWTSLTAAQAACAGRILVVDARGLSDPSAVKGAGQVWVPGIPAGAFRNVDPYLPPAPVAAAGGYVVRRRVGEPEVLLIFRRGVWDLPKGKQDAGESLEACALREVREEIGVDDLELIEDLGTTVHGHAEAGWYRVKTTRWFLMRTSQARFSPQEKEGIEEVAWVPWSDAVQRVGFGTLREHMQQVEPLVLRALAS